MHMILECKRKSSSTLKKCELVYSTKRAEYPGKRKLGASEEVSYKYSTAVDEY